MKKMFNAAMQMLGVMWACTGIYLIGKWTSETAKNIAYKVAGIDHDTDNGE